MDTPSSVVMREEGPALTFSREQIDLIKDTIARDQKLTDAEFRLFLYAAQRQGLDPLAKQIYAVKRNGKMVLQTSIDGYRLCANRSGCYAGNDDPIYDDEEKPRKATVTVWKIVGGLRCAFTATARWDQYYPGDALGFMWRKMPHLMLGKCAEALALRKAFPAELSGTYVDAEMDQAGAADAVPAEVGPPPPPVLPGGPTKWEGHGGQPLTEVPTRVLTAALAYFRRQDNHTRVEEIGLELERRRLEEDTDSPASRGSTARLQQAVGTAPAPGDAHDS